MVSTAVIAQDVQQKDDAKKEAKATKPKKEKKAKEPKAKKEKENKSASKAAAKTTASKTSKTNKKLKKDTPEYEAQMRASKIAMDSVLKYHSETGDMLMKFADIQCEKFGNDPVFMDSVAESFYTIYNNEIFGERRYSALKKMHPEYTEAYLTEARLFHSMAWYYENGDPNKPMIKRELLEKCKIKIDSAKIVMPNSAEPYMVWVNLQAKHKHHTKTPMIDEELQALKQKFPDYPGYRETARYYEDILAKKDKSFLLDAAEYYEKAGKYNELSAAHWTNFALLVYKYYRSFPEENYGINIANKGLEKFPNYPKLLRAKLWNSGVYEKWDEILGMSDNYFELTDTLEPSYYDYKYLAEAYHKKKKYTEAINAYLQELELINDSSKEQLREKYKAMLNIVDCNNMLSKYNDAIKIFNDFCNYKKVYGETIEYADYNNGIKSYIYAAIDTLYKIPTETRIQYLTSADSLLQISAEVSPNYTTAINQRRLIQITYSKISFENGGWKNDYFSKSEILEAAQRLVNSVTSKAKIEDIDYFRLMQGYYWTLLHYLFANDLENMYHTSEIMLSDDMPMDIMLPNLTKDQKADYQQWYNYALEQNIKFQSKYGKKKKK